MDPSPRALQILGFLAVLVIAGSVSVWGLILFRLRQRRQVVPQEQYRQVPWGWVEVALILLVYIVAQFVSLGVIRTLVEIPSDEASIVQSDETAIPAGESPESDAQESPESEADDAPEEARQITSAELSAMLAATAVGNLLTLAIGSWILVARSRATVRDLGIEGRRFGYDLALGTMGFVALVVPVWVLMVLLARGGFEYSHPVLKLLEDDPTGPVLMLCLFLASVVAPVVEEFLFRLVLQGRLEKMEARLFGPPRPNRPKTKSAVAVDKAYAAKTEADVNPYASPSIVSAPAEAVRAAVVQPPTLENVESDGPVAASPGESSELASPIDALPSDASPPAVPPLARKFPGYPRGVAPIMSSSLLFALAHWGQGPAPVPLFVLALGLGYLYQRTHRLLPCIIVHMLLNTSSLLMTWLSLAV